MYDVFQTLVGPFSRAQSTRRPRPSRSPARSLARAKPTRGRNSKLAPANWIQSGAHVQTLTRKLARARPPTPTQAAARWLTGPKSLVCLLARWPAKVSTVQSIDCSLADWLAGVCARALERDLSPPPRSGPDMKLAAFRRPLSSAALRGGRGAVRITGAAALSRARPFRMRPAGRPAGACALTSGAEGARRSRSGRRCGRLIGRSRIQAHSRPLGGGARARRAKLSSRQPAREGRRARVSSLALALSQPVGRSARLAAN